MGANSSMSCTNQATEKAATSSNSSQAIPRCLSMALSAPTPGCCHASAATCYEGWTTHCCRVLRKAGPRARWTRYWSWTKSLPWPSPSPASEWTHEAPTSSRPLRHCCWPWTHEPRSRAWCGACLTRGTAPAPARRPPAWEGSLRKGPAGRHAKVGDLLNFRRMRA